MSETRRPFTRMKWMEMAPRPDGRPVRRCLGLMTDDEYVTAILEYNHMSSSSDLDDGSIKDDVQPDLWEELDLDSI